MTGRTYFLTLLVIPALLLTGIFPALADLSPTDQVRDVIDATLSHPYQAHGYQGIFVQSMETGKVIYDHNGDKLMTPASCMKIIVSSAALDLLGPNYTMQTSVYAAREPKNGVVYGDLILVGHGDTYLKVQDLQQMADALKDMGIKSVKGNITGDDSWFDEMPKQGEIWSDEPDYDSALESALTVNEGYISVHVLPGSKVGDPAIVKLNPDTKYFTIDNGCTTGAAESTSTADATRPRMSRVISITGNIPLGHKEGRVIPETGLSFEATVGTVPGYDETEPAEKLSVGDTPLFTCALFKEILQQKGIKVTGTAVHGIKPEKAVLLTSHSSVPMSRLVWIQDKPSDNFMAECLLKTLGKAIKGHGTSSAGIEVEREWLNKIGVDANFVFIADASGGRRNAISSESLVKILTYMYHTPNYHNIADSFPIAGVDSHLKYRMLDSPAVNNVRAKTGYIPLVCSLAGYVQTLAGEHLAVSVVQNYHMCSLEEAYVMQDVIFTALSKVTTRTDAGSSR